MNSEGEKDKYIPNNNFNQFNYINNTKSNIVTEMYNNYKETFKLKYNIYYYLIINQYKLIKNK